MLFMDCVLGGEVTPVTCFALRSVFHAKKGTNLSRRASHHGAIFALTAEVLT
jgi:hypothetical protein